MIESEFQNSNEFERRVEESGRIREKYPERVPVICEKAPRSNISDIDKTKYLVPGDLTVGQFAYVIRKRLKLKPETAIFIMVENSFPSTSQDLNTLYEESRHEDGFLYLKYSGENTFGN